MSRKEGIIKVGEVAVFVMGLFKPELGIPLCGIIILKVIRKIFYGITVAFSPIGGIAILNMRRVRSWLPSPVGFQGMNRFAITQLGVAS